MDTLLIVTGPRMAGKTTFCRHLAGLARRARQQVGGIISPAVFQEGQKIAIEAEDLRTGQRQRLAERRHPNQTLTGPHTRGWRFHPSSLAWANTVLKTAVPCDLLIIDELGPLELEQQTGWQAGLTAIDSGHYRWAVVVIRPELLRAGRQRWPEASLITIAPGTDSQTLAERLARRLWAER